MSTTKFFNLKVVFLVVFFDHESSSQSGQTILTNTDLLKILFCNNFVGTTTPIYTPIGKEIEALCVSSICINTFTFKISKSAFKLWLLSAQIGLMGNCLVLKINDTLNIQPDNSHLQ